MGDFWCVKKARKNHARLRYIFIVSGLMMFEKELQIVSSLTPCLRNVLIETSSSVSILLTADWAPSSKF